MLVSTNNLKSKYLKISKTVLSTEFNLFYNYYRIVFTLKMLYLIRYDNYTNYSWNGL